MKSQQARIEESLNWDDILTRLKLFWTPFDARYEDLLVPGGLKLVFRDFMAGLIVAMVAIPLAMGFAIASGLNPVHGIVGGAIAGFMGSLFGGSKYQVYGPTAALIPSVINVMHTFGPTPDLYWHAHGVLVLISLIAGCTLAVMGTLGLGRYVAKIPHSIVVGFTIGISVTIVMSQAGEIFGIKSHLDYGNLNKIYGIAEHMDEFNIYCFILAMGTFVTIKALLRVSIFIPAPVVALAVSLMLSTTIWADKNMTRIIDRYGPFPRNLIKFTPPEAPEFSLTSVRLVMWSVLSVVVVCAIESLLCSRMADRLANNTGTRFFPNKELWGQGLVNIVVPLCNGFPHTGALARTATNIKLGAVSPLAGIFKGVLKLTMAYIFAPYLEQVPMACIGGILFFVAYNMVSPMEIREVMTHYSVLHRVVMVYTAVMVILTDFSTGVLSAIVIYFILEAIGIDATINHEESNPLINKGQVQGGAYGSSHSHNHIHAHGDDDDLDVEANE